MSTAPEEAWRTVGLATPPPNVDLNDPFRFAVPTASWASAHAGPIDHEVLQLQGGLRKIIKRERASAEGAERAALVLSAFGWRTRRVPIAVAHGGSARHVVLAGRADADVDAAVEVERALDMRSSDRVAAVVAMGDLLGYPRCCAERFAREDVQDDEAQYARLAGAQTSALDPIDDWVPSELRPFSHFPCIPGCTFSADVARATLDLIRETSTAWALALEHALGSVAVVQAIDRQVLLAHAEMDGMRVRYREALSPPILGISAEAALFRRASARAFHAAVYEPIARGNLLAVEPTALVVERDGRRVERLEFASRTPWVLDFTGRRG